ncbi:PIN domain-containing protein [Duganella sp. HH101]|uniref:PIN domain-containing protein n=1 Tax=Duganella sp. HH101 TaxID=1781066 RepID=UPI001E57952D|nr:PIN domain-containing protein [Duganella sp. HH101]
MQFGLSKRPNARWLQVVVVEFLKRIKVLPWDGAVARNYGSVRALMESQGKILSPLDLLIATHAFNAGAILVTNDKSFGQVPMLQIEDWTR